MSRDDYEQYPDEDTEHDPNAPDPEVLERVTSLFPLLDDLRARFEEPTEVVEGGELAGDDVDGSWPRVSEVAVGSMAAAHDHLLASKLHVDVRRQFVVADATLLRTALLSAAQAVWVLAPDDRVKRQSRSRTLAAHGYEEHMKYLRHQMRVLRKRPRVGADQVARAEARLRAVEGVGGSLGARRDAMGEQEQFNATAVIEAACREGGAFRGHREAVDDVVLQWRHGSAAAHGLEWHLTEKSKTHWVAVDEERGALAVHASLEDTQALFVYAVSLLVDGLELLDDRNKPPAPF